MHGFSACSNKTSGDLHTKLYRWLIDVSKVSKCGSSASACAMSGVTAQCQEQQLNPPAKNNFSQCGLELTDDAGTTFPCAHQVKSSNIVQDHIGCVHTVKFFQKILGLMVPTSYLIPFGLLHKIPFQLWLKSQGFSPRGNVYSGGCIFQEPRLWEQTFCQGRGWGPGNGETTIRWWSRFG